MANRCFFCAGEDPMTLWDSSLLKKGTGTSHTPRFRGLCIVALGASPLFQQADSGNLGPPGPAPRSK